MVATNNGQSNVTVSEVKDDQQQIQSFDLESAAGSGLGRESAVNVVFTQTAKGEVGGSIILVSNASNRVLYLPMAGQWRDQPDGNRESPEPIVR